jgi:transposase-like protein
MSTRQTTADRWRELIERQERSGSSISAFCRRAGVSQPSFYAWRRRLRGEVTFAEVLTRPAAAEIGGIELRLPGGRYVVLRAGFDRQVLRELLQVLEECSSTATREEAEA